MSAILVAINWYYTCFEIQVTIETDLFCHDNYSVHNEILVIYHVF